MSHPRQHAPAAGGWKFGGSEVTDTPRTGFQMLCWGPGKPDQLPAAPSGAEGGAPAPAQPFGAGGQAALGWGVDSEPYPKGFRVLHQDPSDQAHRDSWAEGRGAVPSSGTPVQWGEEATGGHQRDSASWSGAALRGPSMAATASSGHVHP